MTLLLLVAFSCGATYDRSAVKTATLVEQSQSQAAVVWQRSLIRKARTATWMCQRKLGVPTTKGSLAPRWKHSASIPYLSGVRGKWRARARSCWKDLNAGAGLARKIDRGLVGYPLHGHGRDLVRSGKRWNVNPALVAAISGAESTFCVNAWGANCWGYGCPHGSCSISGSSFAQMIELVTMKLRQDYLNAWGKRNVSEIAHTYCPHSDGNNPDAWARSVEGWMVGRFGSTRSVTYPR